MSHCVQAASDSANVAHAGPEDLGSCPTALAGIQRCDSDAVALSASDTEALLQKPAVTPVPRLQLATLCLVRLVDPISFTQV